MRGKVVMAIMALSLGGCFILASPPASAQPGKQQQHAAPQGQSRGAGAPRGGGGIAVAPRGGARTVTPNVSRTVSPHVVRTVTPREVRTVTPRAARTVTRREVRTVTPRATRTVPRREVRTATPRGARTVTSRGARSVTPRVVTPKGGHPSEGKAHVVTAASFRGMPERGAGRATIRGHNYSVWRSGYRVRHGRGWRTFVALGTLGAVAVGSDNYYPYAYVSAPQPYCEGLTEDGCQLKWQEVDTVEGDVVNQCVAYCPWQ